MATLHKDVKSAKLRKYFDDEFPKINTNTTIWNAFLKWSGHQQDGKPSADDAKKAALQVIAKGATQQVNSMDTIVADPKNTANTDRSANGIFYTSDPDTVYMQAAIVEFYDANIDSTVHHDPCGPARRIYLSPRARPSPQLQASQEGPRIHR